MRQPQSRQQAQAAKQQHSTLAHADQLQRKKAWTQGANPVLSRPHSRRGACKFMAKSALRGAMRLWLSVPT
jgi:hypothetical protein